MNKKLLTIKLFFTVLIVIIKPYEFKPKNMNNEKPESSNVVTRWIKAHKTKATALLFISFFFILIFIWGAITFLQDAMVGSSESLAPGAYGGSGGYISDSYVDSVSRAPSAPPQTEAGFDFDEVEPDPIEDIPGIKIIEGRAEVKSKDAQNDEQVLRALTEDFNGYVGAGGRRETVTAITVDLTLRIPSDDFDEFFKQMREAMELKSFSIRDYRIDIERRETELDTVRQAITEYDRLIELTREMELDDRLINRIKQLTDEKIRYQRQENNLVSSLQDSRHKSKYATLSVAITEKQTISVWPEDLGDTFRNSMQQSLNKVTNALTSALGDLMLILTTVVVWILYVLTAVLPLWITYRLLRRAYIGLYRKK